MDNSSDDIAKALTDIIGSIDNITNKFSTTDKLNDSHQQLIKIIQSKLMVINPENNDINSLNGSVGGRRKRNRSSKNKRKSSEEQPEKKTEQEEAPESSKPQKKSFFSRFNPFKTKGGRRSRKHRTTKKGGRRHK